MITARNYLYVEHLSGDDMRVLVLANKWWECEAMIVAMLNSNAFPAPIKDLGGNTIITAPWFDSLASPRSQATDAYRAASRATFTYKTVDKIIFTVEVWCVSDLLEHGDPSSGSQAKMDRMKTKLFLSGEERPDLVIAVGTAGTAIESPNRTGGVAIGTQVFLHNAHLPGTPDANPKSLWSDPAQETLIAPSMDETMFHKLAAFDSASALLHFLPLPRNATPSPIITIGYQDVALGTLNVTDYTEYKFKDPESVKAYEAAGHADSPVSLETTHGLIRLASEPAPFLFVSGITDVFLHFDHEVGTPALADAQNFAAAYNAGITVRYLLAGYLKNLLGL